MKKILILFVVISFFINSFAITIGPVTVKLRNGKEIIGQLVSFKPYRLYVSKNKTLYIIDTNVITDLIYKNQKINIKKLNKIKFDRLLWSDYSDHINIGIGNLPPYSLNKKTDTYDIKSNIASQVNNQKEYFIFKAGESLKSYTHLKYLSYALSITGIIITITNIQNEEMITLGGVLSFSGLIVSLIATLKIRQAGDYLQNSIYQ